MIGKAVRLLAFHTLEGRARDAALDVVRGWTGRTRHPLPVTKGRKP
jgi:hypothetical protein